MSNFRAVKTLDQKSRFLLLLIILEEENIKVKSKKVAHFYFIVCVGNPLRNPGKQPQNEHSTQLVTGMQSSVTGRAYQSFTAFLQSTTS